jgi:hypothetical protein
MPIWCPAVAKAEWVLSAVETKNFGKINSITKLHLVGISTESPKKGTDYFKIFYQNIRGLRKKAGELRSHLYSDFPHVLCLTQYHLKDLQQGEASYWKLEVRSPLLQTATWKKCGVVTVVPKLARSWVYTYYVNFLTNVVLRSYKRKNGSCCRISKKSDIVYNFGI